MPKRHFIAALLAGFIMASCQSGPPHPLGVGANSIHHEAKFRFELADAAPSPVVELDAPAYDGANVANAMRQGAQSSASVPGMTPGAALTGALIGGALAGGMAESAERTKRHEPVKNFLTFAKVSNLVHLASRRALPTQESIAPLDAATYAVRFSPTVNVSADYRTLHLISGVEVRNGEDDVVYVNTFEVYSPPQTGDQTDLSHYWNIDGLVEAPSLVENMMQTVQENFQAEMQHWSHQGKAQAVGPIRIHSSAGQHYERGQVLRATEKGVTLRSLRGHVVTYLGATLVNR